MPPDFASWKRVEAGPLPQPFQEAPADGSRIGALLVQRLLAWALPEVAALSLPVANSETARRWVSVSTDPCSCILPLVSELSTASALNSRSCPRVGAFSLGLPAGAASCAWHSAHCVVKITSPSDWAAPAVVAAK